MQHNVPHFPACLLNKASTGESADMKRLRRLMQPRGDGSFIVPKEIVDKWNDVHGGGRDSVVNMWGVSGSNKDRNCLKLFVQSIVCFWYHQK